MLSPFLSSLPFISFIFILPYLVPLVKCLRKILFRGVSVHGGNLTCYVVKTVMESASRGVVIIQGKESALLTASEGG